MTDISYFQDIPKASINYLDKLKQDSNFNFYPVTKSPTNIGRKINMGYNCYAIKLYKLANEWKNLTQNHKTSWTEYIKGFQTHKNYEFENYFIDPEVIKYFNKYLSTYNLKNITKSSLNLLLQKDYELKQRHIFKTINADSKQAISTLSEIGEEVSESPKDFFNQHDSCEDYLNSYDWSKPWDAGAQFSSLALYSSTFNLNFNEDLTNFIENKINLETGSYFDNIPKSSRQVINGAMKVISGLDWLNHPVHLPNKLIDFCLTNKPEFEGCDLVDYVYVLYKCSSQTNYKKKDVQQVMLETLDYLKLLYHEEENGFSYYINKSQTSYYGINTSKGKNTADIHGTVLSVWAIVMILTLLDKNTYDYKNIKP
jgi:hypothetical protein